MCQIFLKINIHAICWYPKINTTLTDENAKRKHSQTEFCSLSFRHCFMQALAMVFFRSENECLLCNSWWEVKHPKVWNPEEPACKAREPKVLVLQDGAYLLLSSRQCLGGNLEVASSFSSSTMAVEPHPSSWCSEGQGGEEGAGNLSLNLERALHQKFRQCPGNPGRQVTYTDTLPVGPSCRASWPIFEVTFPLSRSSDPTYPCSR